MDRRQDGQPGNIKLVVESCDSCVCSNECKFTKLNIMYLTLYHVLCVRAAYWVVGWCIVCACGIMGGRAVYCVCRRCIMCAGGIMGGRWCIICAGGYNWW